MKVSVIMPLYKPDRNILARVQAALRKQTQRHELIEVENMPEAIAYNTGIKKATGDIIITLSQDCVPENNTWLERLVAPFVDKKVVATVSDVVLVPKDLWNRFDVLTKALTLKEQRTIRSSLDVKACAYRKQTLKKIGLFNEDPNVIGIDDDLYMKMKEEGRIAYPGATVQHYHHYKGLDRWHLEYKYAHGAGATSALYGKQFHGLWKRLARALPLVGAISLLYVFPMRRSARYLAIYTAILPILHTIYMLGFWNGYVRQVVKR